MTLTSDRYRLIVAGRISLAAADLVGARFGDAATIHEFEKDTAVDLAADQPSLRTLATLLWDLGHDLLAMSRLEKATGSPSTLESEPTVR